MNVWTSQFPSRIGLGCVPGWRLVGVTRLVVRVSVFEAKYLGNYGRQEVGYYWEFGSL